MAVAASTKAHFPEFRRNLLVWFDASARDLPWRRTGEPYPIWVSEIMLQQTRVAAVLEHYARFMRLFPSVVALALAQEDEVLAAWSGLGYYRRAKLLHRAARFIVREHQAACRERPKSCVSSRAWASTPRQPLRVSLLGNRLR
jgi:A/G-specific adenine glycosylase